MAKRTTEASDELIQQLAQAEDEPTPSAPFPRALRESAERQRELEQTAEVMARAIRKAGGGRPSNVQAPLISVYNPQGDKDYPRPPLKYRRCFLPFQVEEELLTVEEIQLLNLLEPGRYQVRLNDDTRVAIDVLVRRNEATGEAEELRLVHETAFSLENYRRLPALRAMLRDMLAQRDETRDAAERVPTMERIVEAVERGELPVSVGG